jgi:hypothetical protein
MTDKKQEVVLEVTGEPRCNCSILASSSVSCCAVRTLTGKTLTFEFYNKQQRVFELKKQIQAREGASLVCERFADRACLLHDLSDSTCYAGIPVDLQRLIHGGRQIQLHENLWELNRNGRVGFMSCNLVFGIRQLVSNA